MNDQLPYDDSDRSDDGDDEQAARQSEREQLFYELMDQIERGDGPLEIGIAIENMNDGPPFKFQSKVKAASDLSKSPREMLRIKVQVDRRKAAEWFVGAFKAGLAKGQPMLAALAIIARVDRGSFLDTAAEFFAAAPEKTADAVLDDEQFSGFIAAVHEFDPELLPKLVARLRRDNPLAGQRLRSQLVDASCESPTADRLGLLAAADLRDRLDEV